MHQLACHRAFLPKIPRLEAAFIIRHHRCYQFRCQLQWQFQTRRFMSRKFSHRTVHSLIHMDLNRLRFIIIIICICHRVHQAWALLWIHVTHHHYLIHLQCCILLFSQPLIMELHPIMDTFVLLWKRTIEIRIVIAQTSHTMECNQPYPSQMLS